MQKAEETWPSFKLSLWTPEGLGFRVLGFGGLGFGVLGFKVLGF